MKDVLGRAAGDMTEATSLVGARASLGRLHKSGLIRETMPGSWRHSVKGICKIQTLIYMSANSHMYTEIIPQADKNALTKPYSKS